MLYLNGKDFKSVQCTSKRFHVVSTKEVISRKTRCTKNRKKRQNKKINVNCAKEKEFLISKICRVLSESYTILNELLTERHLSISLFRAMYGYNVDKYYYDRVILEKLLVSPISICHKNKIDNFLKIKINNNEYHFNVNNINIFIDSKTNNLYLHDLIPIIIEPVNYYNKYPKLKKRDLNEMIRGSRHYSRDTCKYNMTNKIYQECLLEYNIMFNKFINNNKEFFTKYLHYMTGNITDIINSIC
jgi:hypothetical protein